MILAALLNVAQIGVAGGSLVFGGWWAFLSAAALRGPKPEYGGPGVRFTVLVPAHNEERLVDSTVRSVLEATYEPQPEVLVVADNCDDGTARVASSAGAQVIERHEPGLRGKSHALDFGLKHIVQRLGPTPDVLVVVDADTTVNRKFFSGLAAVVPAHPLAQARYDAAPSLSDVGRLRRIAFGLVHHARPLGAQRMGLPTTLKGNGMAFRWELIREGIPGGGITEDAEATLAFASRDMTARYVPSARVVGLMAEAYSDAITQDTRWEGGRFALWPRAVRVLFRQAGRGKLVSAAAAAELASPPLTVVAIAAGIALTGGLAGVGSLALGAAAAGSVGTYVALGLAATRASRSDLRALVHVPRFVAHKVAAYASVMRSKPRSWQRTER